MNRWLATGTMLLALTGCSHLYFNVDNWYIRQNAVPQYFAIYDVFYMYSENYDDGKINTLNHDYIAKHTTELFGNKVRVFAPLCRDADDAEEAFDWYLDNYHDKNRPFVFLAEGEGIELLVPLIKAARSDGLVSWHWEEVTTNLVEQINEEVRQELHHREWGDPKKKKEKPKEELSEELDENFETHSEKQAE